MVNFLKSNKQFFLGILCFPLLTAASNIGDFKVGMNFKDIRTLKIDQCKPTKERIRNTKIFYEATICKFNINAGLLKPDYNEYNVIIDNSSRSIKKLSATIYSSNFDKRDRNQKYSFEEMTKWAAQQLLANYKIPIFPKNYYPVVGYGWRDVCVFPPNIIRWMEPPVYIGMRGGVGLATAFDVEIYSSNDEYASIVKNTNIVEKRLKKLEAYKKSRNKFHLKFKTIDN